MGDLRVAFYDPTDLSIRDMNANDYISAVSAKGKGYIRAVGNGEVTIPISELANLTGAYSSIQPLDVCVVYNQVGSNAERICTFVIKNVKLESGGAGKPSYFTLSGPDMLYYLTKIINGIHIGKEYTSSKLKETLIDKRFVYVDHGDLEDETDTSAVFWPKWTLRKATTTEAGKKTIELEKAFENAKASADQFAAGDDFYATYSFTPLLSTKTSIESIVDMVAPEDDEHKRVTITEAVAGKTFRDDDSSPTRHYPVFKPHIFKGDPVEITSGAQTFVTRVRAQVEHSLIPLEDALPFAVSDGDSIKWWNHREPNETDDLDYIMLNAESDDWTLAGASVSSNGSAHYVNATPTFDLLSATAIVNDDYFYAQQTDGDTPEKTLMWKTSSPAATLTLVNPTAAAVKAATASATQCLIHSIKRNTTQTPINVVVPMAGPDYADVGTSWDLGLASGETPNAGLLRLYGITASDTYVTEYQKGKWRVRNSSSSIDAAERVDYPDIEPRNQSRAARIDAAERLQAAAALTLYLRSSMKREYIVETSLPDGVEINQGEQIDLDWTDSEWDEDTTLYISDYEHSVRNTGKLAGQRITKLTLTEDGPFPRQTGANVVASAVKSGLGGPTSISGAGGGLSGGGDTDDPLGDVGDTHPPVSIYSSLPSESLTVDDETQALTFLLTPGDGLELTGTTGIQLDIASNSGLTIISEELSMGAPTDITTTSTNSVSGTGHTHAADAASDHVASPDKIAKSDASGEISFQKVGVGIAVAEGELDVSGDMYFIGQGDIYTTANDLYLRPADDLILEPYGGTIQIGTGSYDADTRTHDAVSGFLGTGWQMSEVGHLDARSAYLEELHVTTFTMEQARVKTGVEFVTQSGSFLTDGFTLPAVGSSVSIYVEDANGLPDIPVFGEDDYVMIPVIERESGGLIVTQIWGQVSSYVDGTEKQQWTYTARDNGLVTRPYTVKEGAAVVDFGQPGDGWVTLNAIDQAGSPYMGLGRWYTNPYTSSNREHPIRLGDLGGVTGDKGTMGLFVGSASGRHFIASEDRVEAHGMRLSMYEDSSGATDYIRVNDIEVRVDYGSGTDTMAPNADVTGDDAQGKAYTENIYYSSGTVGWSLIDDSPASPTTASYIRNSLLTEVEHDDDNRHSASATFDLEGMTSSFTDTEQVEIRAHCTISSAGNARMRLVAEIVDNTSPDYNQHTRTVEICNQDDTTGMFTVYVKPKEVMTESDWDGARLRLHWYIVPEDSTSETIRLDPNTPSIAVGDVLPTGFDNSGETGFWVGYDTSVYKMMLGVGEANGLFWTGDTLEFHDSAGDAVIKLHDTGNSEFTGTMDIASGGEIVAGSTELSNSGIVLSGLTSDPGHIGGSFSSSRIDITSALGDNDPYASIYGVLSGVSPTTTAAWIRSSASVTGGTGEVNLYAENDDGGESSRVRAVATDTESYVAITADDTHIYANTLEIDQGSDDSAIIELRSSDVSHNLGGLTSSDLYGQFIKHNSTNGGTRLTGFTESYQAVVLKGQATTANTTTGTGSQGNVMFDTLVNGSAPGSTDNVFVVRGDTTALAIVKGNGDLHLNGVVGSAFDSYNDAHLCRALDLAMEPAGIIRSQFDDYLQYSKIDLQNADILSEDGSMINISQLQRLHNGAIWQLYTKIGELESKLARLTAGDTIT